MTANGVELPTSSLLDSIVVSNDIHQVSDNSSNSTASSSNNSDTSTVETTTVSSKSPTLPATNNMNDNSNAPLSSSVLSNITTLTNPTTTKSVPKKKPSKPLKPSLKQTSTLTASSHRRHTPSPGSLPASFSPTKRTGSAFGITSSAHTRSNAGTAELLKGVHTNIPKANGGVSAKLPTSKGLINNLMIGKNASKYSKDNKDGTITIRNGLPVRKIMMNTGTLYIDLSTHRAEFVRTK